MVGSKLIQQGTNLEVTLLWYGFDSCVIEHEDLRQEFVPVGTVGLPRRKRFNYKGKQVR